MTVSIKAFALLLIAQAAIAQPPAQQPQARPPAIAKSGAVPAEPNVEKKLQADFKAPAGFTVTLFAGPPVAMYPTCVNESPDGAIFVCVDPNLSLSTLKNVGRVMRLVDTDGDGRADKYTTFAEMDSPRGVVSDGKVVYVMHPPFLTAYRDTNGDGISDESIDLVTGLGFDLDFRGADHTTNNIELGPDGWIYVAVGDYGFIRAVGTDGKQIQNRGGAVVRVRPDGTNLEIVATGTRNIYDVAIDPLARIYTRDNTNDGDGWDTRLHYVAPGANMGYPQLYQNFGKEHFPSLHDYGAGSGVGGLWLQDPSWPAGFNNTLYTGDWTVQKIFRHTLSPKGGIFDVQQDEFLSALRPSDLTIDGSSNLYVSSLAGGQFTYNSDSVGYVVQVRSTANAPSREASVFTATDADLIATLASPVYVHRTHASQELLRRGEKDATVKSLRAMIGDASKSVDARAAAMFTLKQLQGARANDVLLQAAGAADPSVREVALRALADRIDQLNGVTSAPFVKALGDANQQVRIQGIRGIVRLGARDVADALVPLAGGDDQALAHLAINALAKLDAVSSAVKGVSNAATRPGALRALSQMHSPAAATALIERLGKATDAPTRAAYMHALARQYNREGYWRGDWWTTRPQHLGPYFDPAPWEESPRIRAAIIETLINTSGDEFNTLAADLALNQVLPRGAAALLAAVTSSKDALRASLIESIVGRPSLDPRTLAIAAQLDARSPALHMAVAQMLAGESGLSTSALSLARTAVLDAAMDAKVRAQLLGSITQVAGTQGLDASTDILSRMNPAPGATAGDPIEAAWRRFVGDRRRSGELDYFIAMSKNGTPEQRALAYSVLLQSIRAPRTPPAVREKVAPVIDAAWADPSAAASLVQAITIMRLETQYTEKLAAFNAAKPK